MQQTCLLKYLQFSYVCKKSSEKAVPLFVGWHQPHDWEGLQQHWPCPPELLSGVVLVRSVYEKKRKTCKSTITFIRVGVQKKNEK